jgi:hypothetical protein
MYMNSYLFTFRPSCIFVHVSAVTMPVFRHSRLEEESNVSARYPIVHL